MKQVAGNRRQPTAVAAAGILRDAYCIERRNIFSFAIERNYIIYIYGDVTSGQVTQLVSTAGPLLSV